MSGDACLTAGRWRVEFVRRGDRVAHQIGWPRADGALSVLLESLEGTSDEAWPPSPPLQELHVERQSSKRLVALLVGMAGSSHWSVSIEARADEESLVVEAACRVHATPDWLGSTYRLAADATHERDATACSAMSGMVVRSAGAIWRIESESLGSLSPAALAFEDGAHVLKVVAPLGDSRQPHTYRWRYRFTALA